jgi:hypothetical protein
MCLRMVCTTVRKLVVVKCDMSESVIRFGYKCMCLTYITYFCEDVNEL